MPNNLTILAYHRVLDKPDPLRPDETSLDSFAPHMRTLSRFFNVMPLPEAVRALRERTLPPRSVSITFDDGYADNFSVAWPVLRKLGLPATIFVATDFLDGGRMWNDTVIESVRRANGNVLDLDNLGLGRHDCATNAQRLEASSRIIAQLKYLDPDERAAKTASLAEQIGEPLPNDIMLESAQVSELSANGIEIGAHTNTHPILQSLDDDSARYEILEGKRRLEAIIRKPVRCFAYPNGRPGVDYSPRHVSMARDAGFECAVATCSGAARCDHDVFQLPRFAPWAESRLKFGLRLFRLHLT
ncbi:MAG: polysaccharide deacetylase family protein [Woeseiaceae bacterium]|nr:polysaccharide deacetylase family protein [Woeseiaceae bacterium]